MVCIVHTMSEKQSLTWKWWKVAREPYTCYVVRLLTSSIFSPSVCLYFLNNPVLVTEDKGEALLPDYTWARTWQNQQNDLCTQRRLRSACATALVFAVRSIIGSSSLLYAVSDDSDVTGQMTRLIWVFVGRAGHFVGFVMLKLTYLSAWAVAGYCQVSVRTALFLELATENIITDEDFEYLSTCLSLSQIKISSF